MALVTVVIILLSSVVDIDAGMRHTTQYYNATRLAKRAPMMVEKVSCDTATYTTVSLYDFVYKHNCFPAGWGEFLAQKEVAQDINEISLVLQEEAKKKLIEPPMKYMFKAFNVPRDRVKVVIIGQDPVPEAGKATGLAFSLQPGVNPRESVPTVLNMLVELKWEGMNVGLSNGDLSPWLNEGVLLLNAALTVRQGPSNANAGSHQNLWTEFTQLLVQHISTKGQPTAWILWGDQAKDFARKHNLIDRKKHYIKAGGHPSPQGTTAGIRFFGRNYFQCANEFLVLNRRGAVDWSLPPNPGTGTPPENCNADGLFE